ncbi:MAG: hypothetical protein M1832_005144 [Thelocarpon impressellum]|nr:MAG: hypothetical protein M1832_005144 [Thelocarpon impressellum]
MTQLETNLPATFDQLSSEERKRVQEVKRGRLVHFLCAAFTMRQIPKQYDAINQEDVLLRARPYDLVGAPWEGESVALAHALATTVKKWLLALTADGGGGGVGARDAHREESRALAQRIKAGLLRYAETDLERTAAADPFFLDDH